MAVVPPEYQFTQKIFYSWIIFPFFCRERKPKSEVTKNKRISRTQKKEGNWKKNNSQEMITPLRFHYQLKEGAVVPFRLRKISPPPAMSIARFDLSLAETTREVFPLKLHSGKSERPFPIKHKNKWRFWNLTSWK